MHAHEGFLAPDVKAPGTDEPHSEDTRSVSIWHRGDSNSHNDSLGDGGQRSSSLLVREFHPQYARSPSVVPGVTRKPVQPAQGLFATIPYSDT